MVLDAIQDALPAAFSVLLTVWVLLSSYMVLDRAYYEVTEGNVRRAIAGLSAPATERLDELDRKLEPIPRRMREKIASDLRTPERVARRIARGLIQGDGVDRYVKRARGTRKWKRVAALHVLFHAGHPRTLELLRDGLRSEDADVVDASVSLLGNVADARAAETLVRALVEKRYPASRIATQLDHFPIAVPGEISSLLHEAEPTFRYWGVTLLARYATDADIADAVAALSADAHEHVRKAVAQTLGAVGGASVPKAESVLLELVTDPSWIVRAHAARALGDIGRAEHAEDIAPLLADPQWWVRLAAKESLVALGDGAARVVARYLEHVDRFARNGAAEVLQNLGYLDHVLERAVVRGPRSEEGALVKKTFAAGGSGIIASYVERQDADAQARVEGLLDALDLSASE